MSLNLLSRFGKADKVVQVTSLYLPYLQRTSSGHPFPFDLLRERVDGIMPDAMQNGSAKIVIQLPESVLADYSHDEPPTPGLADDSVLTPSQAKEFLEKINAYRDELAKQWNVDIDFVCHVLEQAFNPDGSQTIETTPFLALSYSVEGLSEMHPSSIDRPVVKSYSVYLDGSGDKHVASKMDSDPVDGFVKTVMEKGGRPSPFLLITRTGSIYKAYLATCRDFTQEIATRDAIVYGCASGAPFIHLWKSLAMLISVCDGQAKARQLVLGEASSGIFVREQQPDGTATFTRLDPLIEQIRSVHMDDTEPIYMSTYNIPEAGNLAKIIVESFKGGLNTAFQDLYARVIADAVQKAESHLGNLEDEPRAIGSKNNPVLDYSNVRETPLLLEATRTTILDPKDIARPVIPPVEFGQKPERPGVDVPHPVDKHPIDRPEERGERPEGRGGRPEGRGGRP